MSLSLSDMPWIAQTPPPRPHRRPPPPAVSPRSTWWTVRGNDQGTQIFFGDPHGVRLMRPCGSREDPLCRSLSNSSQ